MTKKFKIVISSLIIALMLSGCGAGNRINETAYAVGMAIDSTDSGIILSLRFEGTSSDKPETKKPVIISKEAENIQKALAKIEESISKRISLTHTKLLIFSEETAKNGIKKYVTYLMGSNQFRPNTLVCLFQTDARLALKEFNQNMRVNSAKFYTSFFSKKSGQTVKTVLRDLYFNITTETMDSVVPFISLKEDENGEMVPEVKTAVFKGDALKGVLPENLGLAYNLVSCGFKENIITVNNADGAVYAVKLLKKGKPRYRVNIKETNPSATITLNLIADILNVREKKDDEIKNLVKETVEKDVKSFFEECKRLGCDCTGLKKQTKKAFFTINEWENNTDKVDFSAIEKEIVVNITINDQSLVQN